MLAREHDIIHLKWIKSISYILNTLKLNISTQLTNIVLNILGMQNLIQFNSINYEISNKL